jgi:hypothetical protein
MAVGDQLLDHGDDLRHVRGHFRLDVRRHHAQRGHVFTVGGGERSVMVLIGTPCSRAAVLILSSTSVMLRA